MTYYLFIPFVIVLILFFPIKGEARVSFNVLDFSGAYGIFVYNLKLQHRLFWIKGKKIILKKENSIETKELSFSSREVIFVEMFTNQIKDKTRLRKLSVIYTLGVDDAFLSAMLGGYINFALTTFYTTIKNKKPTATLEIADTISYNRQVCQFAATISISISLFDIVYSLLNSVILTWKKYAKITLKAESKNTQA